jgi:hypothetical protein
LEGSIIQSVSHGFVSGGMFLLVESYMSVITLFLYYFGGLVHIMPVYAVLLVVLQWLILHSKYKAALWENLFFPEFIKQNVAAVIGLRCVVWCLFFMVMQ